jgi:uncharacterized protein (DUF433 family)
MTLSFAAQFIPLAADADGVVRVANTRVTLDTLVAAFRLGATAEEIVQQYPSLDLADVYQVISYYLRRPLEVEAYLRHRIERAESIRQQTETLFHPEGIRERLLARRTSKEA